MSLLKSRPVALPPITEDGSIDQHNISAIQVRNAGTAVVLLFNGLYTLDPKETLAINSTEENAALEIENIPVTFDTSTGSIKRLEIIVLRTPVNC